MCRYADPPENRPSSAVTTATRSTQSLDFLSAADKGTGVVPTFGFPRGRELQGGSRSRIPVRARACRTRMLVRTPAADRRWIASAAVRADARELREELLDSINFSSS